MKHNQTEKLKEYMLMCIVRGEDEGYRQLGGDEIEVEQTCREGFVATAAGVRHLEAGHLSPTSAASPCEEEDFPKRP